MGQPGSPRPPRSGPRPLPLHLLNQTACLLTSPAGLPALKPGSPFWRAALRPRAESLAGDLAGVAAEAFATAVEAEARQRLDHFLRGVEAYRRHPYRRTLTDPPTAWRRGTTRLLAYEGAGGAPVLVVPSLINRAHVLDLTAGRSLMRDLAGRGFRPYLVDWGGPGAGERGFSLDDYIAGRLSDALDVVRTESGRTPAVVGYCMGGLLALALAALRPDAVAALALLATPWDFHAAGGPQARLLRALEPWLARAIDDRAGLPVEALQALFASIDPVSVGRKFAAFADLKPEGTAARDFVAIEDWLNDGVPLAAAVARECLFSWYGRNDPASGRWVVGGRPVTPRAIACPSLVMIPQRDRIVPPESALPLAAALPGSHVRIVPAGHVGMVVGRRAKGSTYGPLARWLAHVAVQ